MKKILVTLLMCVILASCEDLKPLNLIHDAAIADVMVSETINDTYIRNDTILDTVVSEAQLYCSKLQCQLRCTDPNVHPTGYPLPAGCSCLGLLCIEWGPVVCSPNTDGCVVFP